MQKTKCYLAALVSGVLLVTGILAGCGQSKKDDHLTVYLWENRLMKNIAPYIHEQFPDQDIEFIIGNNDTDLYSYFKEHGELPDIMTVRRFSGTDAQDLQPYLMDFASYDVVSKYYSYAVEYYKNTDDEIQWLPICALPQTIIANKTLFDQYGIKVPENYEEYVQVCQQFYDKGIKPYSMDLAEDWSNQEIIQAAAIGEFTSLDGIDWRNKAETSAGEIKFDDVLWKRIFSETSQFLKDSHFSEEDINVNSNTDSDILDGMRFLCAEDNELNAEILMELLKLEGAECTICENGKRILEAFEQSVPGEYDMILMDVQMPVMNGYEATKAIRRSSHEQAKTIPIIAMTANAFSEDMQHTLAVGMNAHISKPVDMKLLKKTIRNIKFGGDEAQFIDQ